MIFDIRICSDKQYTQNRSDEPDLKISYCGLKIRGKLLTRLRSEDDSLVLPDVPLDERDMLIDADPGAFHTTPHYDGYPIVLARLDALEPARLMPFLERRWRRSRPGGW